eukprot:gene5386-15536_t
MVNIHRHIINKEREIWVKMATRGKGNRNDQDGRRYGRGNGYGIYSQKPVFEATVAALLSLRAPL